MGENVDGGSAAAEDAQAASNAGASEGASPAPGVIAGGDVAPDAGSAAADSIGATQALTGDETDEQIEAHFRKLEGTPMTSDRVEQLIRLSKANRSSKSTLAELERARGEASALGSMRSRVEAAKARYMAEQPKSRAVFDRLGDDIEATLAFMSDPEFRDDRINDLLGPQPVAGLDTNDPVQRMIAELTSKVDGLVSERDAARQAAETEENEAAYAANRDAVIDSLGLKDDASKALARALVTGLHVEAALYKPDIAIKEMLPELTKMMKGISVAVSSEAEKEAEEAKPVVPTTAKAPPSLDVDEGEEMDLADIEDAKAAANAARQGG
jgi:hypothetical protein